VEVSQRTIHIGEVVIRRTFTVTAVKLFTQFIVRLKIVYRPTGSNRSSSKIDILNITGSINVHFT